ncbi:MAG: hypothetical protein RLZZ618_2993 [Pseudomonadota bacterium]|jgi:lipopolysaccharide export system protein LptC
MDATPSAFTPVAISGDVPRAVQPLRWRLVQMVQAYLPLLLMLLLALGTWWLAKNSRLGTDAPTPVAPRHEPDYEMSGFAVQRFAPGGELQAQIEGDALRHYPDDDTTEVDIVKMRAIDKEGRVTRATAKQALANGPGTEIQLRGSANVLRESLNGDEPVDFHSEFLHAYLDSQRVFSNKPVTVVRGSTSVRADGMDYTHADQIVKFSGRARATFSAKPAPKSVPKATP